jgi:hypothetical protein
MIAATFHGPNYDSSVHDESTIEVFHSLGHAMTALFDRYDSGGARRLNAHYLDDHKDSTYWPLVTEGHYLRCYLIDSLDGSVPPGEEAVMDALTAVHSGVPDYTLTLVPPFGERATNSSDTIAVSVSRGR